jgi:hypothetical protein
MKKHTKIQGEEGFVLIAALLILLVLTVLGIAVNRNTNTEWRIAMNDRLHKDTFYAADAAAELAQEIVLQNVVCQEFNDDTLPGASGYDIHINPINLWANPLEEAEGEHIHITFPADREYPADPGSYIKVGGEIRLTAGSAIQMAAGYEGLGQSLSGGGGHIHYAINVRQIGRNGSEATICVQYDINLADITGRSGDCIY